MRGLKLITITGLLCVSMLTLADEQANIYGISQAPPKEPSSMSQFFLSYSKALKTCQVYQDTILGGLYTISIEGKQGEQCAVEILTPGLITTCLFSQADADAVIARLAQGSEQLKGANQIVLADKADIFPAENCQSKEGEVTYEQKLALKVLMEQIGNQPLEAKQWEVQ